MKLKMISAIAKLKHKLEGKKTYLSAVLFGVLGGLKWYGLDIPEFTWPLLAAAGMGGMRAAISKIEGRN